MPENNADSRNSSPGPNVKFDLFKIGPNHVEHSQSTSIIKLDESGKIFCPVCLEKISLEGIDKDDLNAYDSYMKNMLEVLDQRTEQVPLRRIVMQFFEIMLKKRYIEVKTDNDFHNVVRIFHKIMKTNQFTSIEFPPIARVNSIIWSNFDSSKPVPLVLIWKIARVMLDYAERELENHSLETVGILSEDRCKLIGSFATVINSYLEVLNRFGNSRSSNTVFVLFEKDYSRENYEKDSDSQLACLNFMTQKLLLKCWNFFESLSRALTISEKDMVREIFSALNKCVTISMNRERPELLKYLTDKDCLQVTHLLLYRNIDVKFRQPIREFINLIVRHYIIQNFGSDRSFNEFITSEDIVETNHKNAIVHSTNPCRYKRTIYYILFNCVAVFLKSKYLSTVRVQKVIKAIEPDVLGLKQSIVLMRAYLYIASKVSARVDTYNNTNVFIQRTWKKMREKSENTLFNQQFCFHEQVLYWACDQPNFIKLVTVQTIKYILDWSSEDGSLTRVLKKLLKYKHYKSLVTLYLTNEKTAADRIKVISQCDLDSEPNSATYEDHINIVSTLSAILLSIFHSSILHSINTEDSTGSRKVYRSINLIITFMKECEHFKFVLDDQFIVDIFKFLEQKYKTFTPEEDTLILMNEFISVLMIRNSPYLMKVLKHLDYSIIGYMYQRLADYTKGDYLAESIASLLVTYDSIDYPLLHNIGRSLNTMALSVVNWMLSKNKNLHILSLMIAKNILKTDTENTIRACVTTGLMHMLFQNPTILENRNYMNHLLSIADSAPFKYNPLINDVIHVLSEKPRRELLQVLDMNANDRPPSPALSFSSAGSSLFREEQYSVSQIISQLGAEDGPADISSRIPDSLYIAGSMKEQHSNAEDTEEWLRTARQHADAF